MNVQPMKMIAAACVLLALVLMLLLPFVSVVLVGIGLNGIRTLQISGWVMLPILTSVVLMGVCLAVQNRIVGVAALAVGAFIPLLTVEIVKGQCASSIMSILSSMVDLGSFSGFASGIMQSALTAGLGVILYLILVLVAAVLYFLADSMTPRRKTTAGIEKDGADW